MHYQFYKLALRIYFAKWQSKVVETCFPLAGSLLGYVVYPVTRRYSCLHCSALALQIHTAAPEWLFYMDFGESNSGSFAPVANTLLMVFSPPLDMRTTLAKVTGCFNR